LADTPAESPPDVIDGRGETEPPTAGDDTDAAGQDPAPAATTDDGEPVDADGAPPAKTDDAEPAGTDDAEPAKTDGARADLPDDNVLAFVGDHLALLAQAEGAESEGEPETDSDAAPEIASDADGAATAEPETDADSGTTDATAEGGSPATEEQPATESEGAAAAEESTGEAEPKAEEKAEPSATEAPSQEETDKPAETDEAPKEGTDDTPADETPAAGDVEKPAETKEPAEAAPADPTDDTKTGDTQPPDETKAAGTDDSPTGPPPAEGQPADDGAAEPEPGAEPLRPATDEIPGSEDPEQPPDSIYRCESNLQFDEPISADSVKSKIKSAAKKLDIKDPQMRLAGENASTEKREFAAVSGTPRLYSSAVTWPVRWAMADDQNLHDFGDLESLRTLTGRTDLEPPPEGTKQGFAWENGTLYIRLEGDTDPKNANILISPSDTDLAARWDGESSKGFTRWGVKFTTDAEQTAALLSTIRDDFANAPVWPSSNKIGAAVAGKMKQMAVGALLLSLLGIVGYIWFRFQKVVYGLAAVVALVHDVAITLGAIAVSAWLANYLGFLMIDNFKISLPVVAAFLTIIGYSLNDTIVVFDRIREVKGKSPNLTMGMVNTSINQTLSRTLLTSITTLLVVAILYFLGGQGIHSFAFCLLIGVLVGTYSSIFVASPFLLWMTGATKPATKQAAR
jgi:preprotein translocase SecF subunit